MNLHTLVNGNIEGKSFVIDYTNYRGERSIRTITPVTLLYGSNEYHPEPQFLLHAYDNEKKDFRYFAVRDIHQLQDA